MNSLERVLTALSHKEPDRVPLGEWGIDHDHVSRILGRHTYWRNRKDCTLAYWDGRRDEVVNGKIRDYSELIEKLDYDIVPVHTVPPTGFKYDDVPQLVAPGIWRDSKGNEYHYAASNDSIMNLSAPPPAREELSEKDINQWLESATRVKPGCWELVDAIQNKFGDRKAVVFREMSILHPLFELFGGNQEHQLIIPMLAPDEVRKMMDPVFEYNKWLIDVMHSKGIKFVMQGSDLGDNRSCIYQPSMLREFFFPVLKRVANYAHSKSMHMFFHCCGNVWEVMDDFIGYSFAFLHLSCLI